MICPLAECPAFSPQSSLSVFVAFPMLFLLLHDAHSSHEMPRLTWFSELTGGPEGATIVPQVSRGGAWHGATAHLHNVLVIEGGYFWSLLWLYHETVARQGHRCFLIMTIKAIHGSLCWKVGCAAQYACAFTIACIMLRLFTWSFIYGRLFEHGIQQTKRRVAKAQCSKFTMSTSSAHCECAPMPL